MNKILIVEDDQTLNKVLSDTLREQGFEIIQAFDGEEALKKTRSEKPDLILLDLLLPKKHGLDVLIELKGDPATKAIPVIVDTASVTNASEGDVIEAGAALFLIKSEGTIEHITKAVQGFFSGEIKSNE